MGARTLNLLFMRVAQVACETFNLMFRVLVVHVAQIKCHKQSVIGYRLIVKTPDKLTSANSFIFYLAIAKLIP